MEKPIKWLFERDILIPKNDTAAAFNENIVKLLSGSEKDYRSIDSVLQTDDAVNYPIEFLNTVFPHGFPASFKDRDSCHAVSKLKPT